MTTALLWLAASAVVLSLVGWRAAVNDARRYRQLYHEEHLAFVRATDKGLDILDAWEAAES